MPPARSNLVARCSPPRSKTAIVRHGFETHVESDLDVSKRFSRDRYYLRQDVPEMSAAELQRLASRGLVNKIPCETHVYVDKARVRRALDTSKPLRWAVEGVRVVKIISERRRTAHDHKDSEILLWQKRRWRHPNLVPFLETDPHHCYITMPLVGTSLNEVLRALRLEELCTGRWNPLPELFVWTALRQVLSALAYLHSGVSPDSSSSTVASSKGRVAIALDIEAADIHLDPLRTIRRGYPSAVVVNFSSAVENAEAVDVSEWKPARVDLENVAAIFHELAHGHQFSNSLQPRGDKSQAFCNCLDSSIVPRDSFLRDTTAAPSKRLRSILDSICYADGASRVTAIGALSKMDERGYVCPKFSGPGKDPRTGAIPEHLQQLIWTGGVIMNEDLRKSVPALADYYGDWRDPRETSPRSQ